MTRLRCCAALLLATLVLALPAGGIAAGLPAMPEPIDPQSWVLPEEMTWDDYVPIPGVDWSEPDRQPPKRLRAALILGDFADRDFVVTRAAGTDLVGNPSTGSIARADVADLYTRFLFTEPSELNHGHTANEYWLEHTPTGWSASRRRRSDPIASPARSTSTGWRSTRAPVQPAMTARVTSIPS